MGLILYIVLALIVVIVLFVALDYFARAAGGDVRLWLLLKGVVVLLALLLVLERAGLVAL
jgi:hypothetical protein